MSDPTLIPDPVSIIKGRIFVSTYDEETDDEHWEQIGITNEYLAEHFVVKGNWQALRDPRKAATGKCVK
tara:strand:- start:1611 stop:1817 length:207 start_codon:yes stop_codon:yes gene_type:complete